MCSTLLAVGVISLVFAVAYVDRKRKRDKQRRLGEILVLTIGLCSHMHVYCNRYITQVLKMYEDSMDAVSGDSDSNSDDNPETKNLFDRL